MTDATIADRLRRKRFEDGLSLAELGERLGTSSSTLSRFENERATGKCGGALYWKVKEYLGDTIPKPGDGIASYMQGPVYLAFFIERDENLTPAGKQALRAVMTTAYEYFTLKTGGQDNGSDQTGRSNRATVRQADGS